MSTVQPPASRSRRILTVVLGVLAVLACVLALLSLWTFRTLTDTELFVQRVGSVIDDPVVAQQVGDVAAERLIGAVADEDRPRLEARLADGVTALIGTDGFRQAWDAALGASHRLTIGVLSGADTGAVTTTDGVVTLDLTQVINALVGQASGALSDALGRPITPPEVTEQTTDQAIADLNEALGTQLPADFGSVTLIDSEDLAAAQAAYRAAKVAVVAAPVVALLLVGLTIAVAQRRVRTALWLVIGTAVLLGLVGLLLNPLRAALVNAASDAGVGGAIGAAFASLTSSLVTGIIVVAVLGALAALGLLLTRRRSLP